MDLVKIKKVFSELGLKSYMYDIDITLPIAYRKKFNLQRLDLEHSPYLLIIEKRRGSLENFIEQAEYISSRSNLPYILVFTQLLDEERKLLLRARISFIDYRGNLFLPELGMALRKNISVITQEKFTPSEQLVLAYLLSFVSNDFELDMIENMTKLSKPSIYRALKKFSTLGWLFSEYGHYALKKSPIDIFEESKLYLFNPIKKTIYFDEYDFQEQIESNTIHYVNAGLMALSDKSNLVEPKRTIAIENRIFRELEKKQTLRYYEEIYPGMIEVQLWDYRPFEVEGTVDFLSLYTSIDDEGDDRIQQALETFYQSTLSYGNYREEHNGHSS